MGSVLMKMRQIFDFCFYKDNHEILPSSSFLSFIAKTMQKSRTVWLLLLLWVNAIMTFCEMNWRAGQMVRLFHASSSFISHLLLWAHWLIGSCFLTYKQTKEMIRIYPNVFQSGLEWTHKQNLIKGQSVENKTNGFWPRMRKWQK